MGFHFVAIANMPMAIASEASQLVHTRFVSANYADENFVEGKSRLFLQKEN
jgi:hypothetical protein